MGIEYELKFRANPQQQEDIDKSLSGTEMIYEMQTTYYDTPEGTLSQRHYTLRRRMENDISVCTLKAPVAGHGRGEWETECDSIEKAIPILCDMGAPEDLKLLTQPGLVEVCGAKFKRIAKTLVLEQGVLELALDKGILMGGGKELPLCEVEVELKSGTAEFANAFAANLAKKFGLVPENRSKFRRALLLSKGEL